MIPPTPSARRALVVGCGVAGPVLALFLRRAGFAPTIHEGRPEPRDEAGAFLNLAPNGLAVLDNLGLAGEVLRLGTPTTAIALLNHRGRELGRIAAPTTLLRRGALTGALREAALAAGVPIRWGQRLVGIEVTPHGTALARFADGSEAEGDLLVGGDGLHSATRRAILPDAPEPAYAGLIDTGAFARLPSLPADGVMRMTFGRRAFFGHQTTPAGDTFWFENLADPSPPDRDRLAALPDADWRRRLLDLHRGDHPPIAALIAATAGPLGRWPVYDLPPLPTWHRGPVVLVGDAAHAISPSSGQGASLALEDALVLARCLRDAPDIERAFAAYETRRKPRVEKLAAAARRTDRNKAAPNALARAARDLALPLFLKLGARQTRQTHAHRDEWDEPAAPSPAPASSPAA